MIKIVVLYHTRRLIPAEMTLVKTNRSKLSSKILHVRLANLQEMRSDLPKYGLICIGSVLAHAFA